MFTNDQGVQQETPQEIGIERKLDLILAELKNIEGAFAKDDDGNIDFGGHRRYHEAMIESAKEQAQFWKDLRLDIAKKGTLFLIVTVCGLLVLGIQTKFGFLTK